MNRQGMKAPDELHPFRSLVPVGRKKQQQCDHNQDRQQKE
jgi:hypothetical protein